MFGRRRRVAAAVVVAPAPELSDERILELLHDKLADLVGVNGLWTLVPRRSDDTDIIFHGLKSEQIATDLALTLRAAKAAPGDEPSTVVVATPAKRLSKARAAAVVSDAIIEPTALSWTPGPISVWAEPERATVTGPVTVPSSRDARSTDAQAKLVA
ncbi:hypothetical protein JF66_06170 [Cryobacterium sp. MLB-32]|uniref:hypothetical protein n=1 Tax=Cryobacterium sp. MLB-32 TaxID=1529318 RepID=UPI0004E67B1B|nr:hypothetical protein [Cryobacterium sp. MLB-32]KFF60179.1 hypothetical protein JF66_06170 [Cryobacterium sp. MLB-32]